ncbi:MAG: acyl carrier protein [Candidatus Cryptobacteroides sp.]|nr:phosphopantetheine-binding protein [Bacteroidales bacterium]
MSREELIAKVNQVLSEEFESPVENMLPDAPMMEVLDLDSLDIVDVVVLVEKHFGFVLKKEDFRTIKSFSDFYDLVENRLG